MRTFTLTFIEMEDETAQCRVDWDENDSATDKENELANAARPIIDFISTRSDSRNSKM